MRVVSKRRLREFWEQHQDAREPLSRWYKTALNADWSNLHEVRQSFPTADGIEVDPRSRRVATVFNICGNKYRLTTRIIYAYRRVYVRLVLTHQQYDRGNWKAQI